MVFVNFFYLCARMVKPLILISNDDGYHAKGMKCLIDFIRDIGDIVVCAPESTRSGYSRAFSATTPLTLKEREIRGINDAPQDSEENSCKIYSCSGTPVDCLKMAYNRLCPRKPDLVLGGINHGGNESTNCHYSGTVGIVMEGALKGIPSIAFSLCDFDDEADFEPMRQLVRKMVKKVLEEGLPTHVCLNVNVPKEWNGETKTCRMAHGHWRQEVDARVHPGNGKPYYWMTGYYQNDEPHAEDTDAWAIAQGYAAITPLTVDQTADIEFRV